MGDEMIASAGKEKESSQFKSHGGVRPGAGRPLGSPNRLTRPLKELASKYGPDALKTLVEIMTGGENEQARISAAKELLDRGYGRPRPEMDPKEKQIRVLIYGPNGYVPVPPAPPGHSVEDAETVEAS